MLAHTVACAQVSPHAEFSPVRYSSDNPLRYRITDLDPRLNISQQQSSLEQQAAQLQGYIAQHNQQIQQFNQQTEKLKKLHQQMAESVAQFNQTFKPEVLHKRRFEGNQISIYEFSSVDDLRLTLAHEFGHALGLKHTHNPKSLMYPHIKEQDAKDFQLTDTDLELLGLSR